MKVIFKVPVSFNGRVRHRGTELDVNKDEYEKLKEYVDKVAKEPEEPKEPKEKK